ncbi:MAG TPA: type III pantothenate kinase [Clostridia bacterium]|nr:type III pantothenate kinase [Clostridia bacterium]
MILVIDVGNSNIVLGVYNGKKLVVNWRISTNRETTADEYGILIRDLFNYARINSHEIKAIVISSVVPPLMSALSKMANKYFNIEPLIVGPGIKTGISIKYEDPREVGADRIVNAVAVLNLYGGPAIVVDFGTAITFCAISGKGEYLGGAITPGVGIATEALFQRAAKLPRIDLVKPKNVIGKNTVVSMQAGIIYGYVGLVDEIVNRMKVEMGEGDPLVIATGGIAELIGPETQTINIINPFLTLEGLRIIYELNHK